MKLKEQIIGLLHKKKESKIGFWLAVILAVATFRIILCMRIWQQRCYYQSFWQKKAD